MVRVGTISILLVLLASTVFAKDDCEPSVPSLRNPGPVRPGEVTCYGRVCYYISRKSGTSILVRELNKAATGSVARIFSPRDGFVAEGRDRGELSFWHRCKDKLEAMKTLVVQLDSAILSTGREEIQMWLKIYHITSGSFNSFSFGITGMLNGNVDTKPPRAQLAQNDKGGFDLSYAFGNLTNDMLSINLQASRSSQQSYSIRDVPFTVLEGEDIQRSFTRNVFRDNPGGINDPNIEQTGYTLGGRPYVDLDENGQPIVVIKDFRLNYGLAQPDDPNVIAERLLIDRWEVRIPRGKPLILNAENLSLKANDNSQGLPFYLENSDIREDSKLVVFLVGWPKSAPPEEEVVEYKLSSDEIAALPAEPSKDLLKSLEFDVVSTGGTADFDLIQFNAPEEVLSRKNYNRILRVTVKGGGMPKKSGVVEAQELVKGTYQLPSLLGVDPKGEAKLKLTVEWLERDHLPKGFKRKKRFKLLHYQELGRVVVH